MRIRCPSCLATYQVADSLFENPRTVRCARCANDWVATALIEPEAESVPAPVETAGHEMPPAQPAAEPEAAPSDPMRPAAVAEETPSRSAIERLTAAARTEPTPGGRSWLLTSAWAASFAILAGLGAGAYVKRDELMRFWPASIRVYAMIGLAPGDMIRNGKIEPMAATSGKATN